jgi:hypothetical protein
MGLTDEAFRDDDDLIDVTVTLHLKVNASAYRRVNGEYSDADITADVQTRIYAMTEYDPTGVILDTVLD